SVPCFRYQQRGDSLIIKPLGDPTFLHSDFEIQLADSFLRQHQGPIFVDFQANQVVPWAPGWTWEDYFYPFAAERSLMPIYGNLASISLPASQNAHIIPASLSLREATDQSQQRVQRAQHQNEFTYPKRLRGSGWEVSIPFMTSEALTLSLLSDTLNRSVQAWSGSPLGEDAAILYTQPIDSLYQYMLQKSDNFFAEQMLIMCAALRYGSVDSEKMIRYSQDSLLNNLPDPVRWVDGAGLSRYNLVSPADLTWLLDKMYNQLGEERILALLPAGGVSGTLEKYYAGEDGIPYIFAKTGTLSNNHNLSGFIRCKSGKVLIFSIMQNHYLFSSSVVKPQIEAFLKEVYQRY
ncbi:MAG: D-alanyl-D-alanine carboxypeptidase, partial [Bacteroidota bacterium]